MLKKTHTYRVITCLAAATLSQQAMAERNGYSFFGIGFESVGYEEHTVLPNYIATVSRRGEKIDTDYSGINFSQRAGAYVAIDKTWGFYINNSSTLGSQSHTEDWRVNGQLVQQDSMTLYRGDTNIWVTRNLTDKHHILFGGTYNRIDYKRFNFEVPASLQGQVADPGDTTISEEVTEFIGEIGYEYNEFFIGKTAGIKTQLKLIAGVPVYTHVRNTALDADRAFTDSFAGYNLRAIASIGYQFSEKVLVSATIDANYQSRDGDIRKNNATGNYEILPDRTFAYVQPSINFLWSF